MVKVDIEKTNVAFSDMVEAWNVDVAAELENYLGELEHIHFSFDSDSSLNFAQG